ncbi:MAG: type II 3-dehydroquinate dehydratase [Deltaproteobacteria bacterium RIFCSPHIGHO2_02_FULL_40_11]|nr:MAG: type II 3-dehydroquinate dehydratase [Deltaproteobacteria bacterium RIFCSPHIGHO2_02_FULL_40_11]
MMKHLLVIHGPNLNKLGHTRAPKWYGSLTLLEINRFLTKQARLKKYQLSTYQSNVEGQIVNKIQSFCPRVKGILINPAAYSHTSVAIRDALMDAALPCVEVHMSNIYQREPFRRHSLISDVVSGQVIGFGPQSYRLGLEALMNLIEK